MVVTYKVSGKYCGAGRQPHSGETNKHNRETDTGEGNTAKKPVLGWNVVFCPMALTSVPMGISVNPSSCHATSSSWYTRLRKSDRWIQNQRGSRGERESETAGEIMKEDRRERIRE